MTDIKINPVKTEFSNYDVIRIEKVEPPMGPEVTMVSLVDSEDVDFPEGQSISTYFPSVPEDCFAYNPDSYCDQTIPQLEEQGLITKSAAEDLHSGFNSYPIYKLSDKVLAKLD